jgi:hypothetical protein
VRRALGADPATGRRRWSGRTFLYQDYGDAELGYAITDHVAQGRIIYTGLALITGTEDRQHAYVALSRAPTPTSPTCSPSRRNEPTRLPARAPPPNWPATTAALPDTATSWLSLLAATTLIDLHRDHAAAAHLRTAAQLARETGHPEIAAWCPGDPGLAGADRRGLPAGC